MSRIEVRQITADAYLVLHEESENPSKENSHHYAVQNISPGGVRFVSDREFKIGQKVELALYLNGKLSHSAHGRICYCDDRTDNDHIYYGVSFLDKFISLHH